jgi:hypothetical protein
MTCRVMRKGRLADQGRPKTHFRDLSTGQFPPRRGLPSASAWSSSENHQNLAGGAPSPPNARAALTEQRPPPGNAAASSDTLQERYNSCRSTSSGG